MTADLDNLIYRILTPQDTTEVVWHYTSVDGALGIVQNREFGLHRW